jgi:hypothetical protein
MYHHLTLTIISFLIIALIQVTEEELIDQVKDFFQIDKNKYTKQDDKRNLLFE